MKKGIVILLIVLVLVGFGFLFLRNNKSIHETENDISQEENSEVEEYYSTGEKKAFSIKDKDFDLYEDDEFKNQEYSGVKLLEYDNSNEDYAEIYYVLYDYTTDPSYGYWIEITDNSSRSLLLSGEKRENIIGGMVISTKIKKQDFNEKINILVYENIEDENEKEVERTYSAQTQIDLNQDLEEMIKIDRSADLIGARIGDVDFQYIGDDDVYYGTTQHAYSTRLVGETYSLPIKVQFGNRLVYPEHIDFWCEKNVNQLTLEEAFEALVLINGEAGQYGLSDVYGLDIMDNRGELIDTVLVDFDDMLKLCKGETIEIDGKEYQKEDFDTFAEMIMQKEADVEIGNGIKAIKYYFGEDKTELTEEHYMFASGDSIYYIRVPVNERIEDEIQSFLDYLKLN